MQPKEEKKKKKMKRKKRKRRRNNRAAASFAYTYAEIATIPTQIIQYSRWEI